MVGSLTSSLPTPLTSTRVIIPYANEYSRGLARLAGRGQNQVTSVEPGTVATELSDYIFDEEAWERMARIMSVQALKAEDTANAVIYATSQLPRINGNELSITPTEQV